MKTEDLRFMILNDVAGLVACDVRCESIGEISIHACFCDPTLQQVDKLKLAVMEHVPLAIDYTITVYTRI